MRDCPHEIQYERMCAVCGKDVSQYVYLPHRSYDVDQPRSHRITPCRIPRRVSRQVSVVHGDPSITVAFEVSIVLNQPINQSINQSIDSLCHSERMLHIKNRPRDCTTRVDYRWCWISTTRCWNARPTRDWRSRSSTSHRINT